MARSSNQDTVNSLIASVRSETDIAVFNKLNVRDWVALYKSGARQNYDHDAVILQAGQQGTAIYFIIEGGVRIERPEAEHTTMLARLSEGNVFGEVSFLDGAPISADVVAEGATEVLKIDNERLKMLVQADGEFGMRLYQSLAITLAKRLRATNQTVG
ncbi:MAG: cyclic nucleotide-binding domain-containing protein [Rhodospirillales bacterium]|nr:cyclic nucleotide-binding domain-containing protein [Rhodospirillales bacterium]